MTNEVNVLAEVRIPLDRIIDAIGPELRRAVLKKSTPRLKPRPTNETMKLSIERVISALDHLERVTHTVGEPHAREALMNAVRGLRKAHILKGRK